MRCVFLSNEYTLSHDSRWFTIPDVRSFTLSPPTAALISSHPSRCNRTAWIEIAIFVFVTLMAQIFLTVRSVGIFHPHLVT